SLRGALATKQSHKTMDILNKILPRVRKPSRYINSEWNSVHKKTADVSVCLCFPDLYELGASNLGVEILYHVINGRKDSLAERCYCPDVDFEEILRKEGICLFSLESMRPLGEFDVLGFSLQYELCFTNVLTMLDLAGIPWTRKERDERSSSGGVVPLVIAGGPVCFNPAPVEDFFDAFVIGDGEDVINEILDVVGRNKSGDGSAGRSNNQAGMPAGRRKVLDELSRIKGVYVPGHNGGAPVERRIVELEKAFFPVRPIVPYVETVHNRLNVEINRGCVFGCKFCHASRIYSPWRERSVETVLKLIKEGIANTGYNEVSLSSFCVSHYSGISELLRNINPEIFISVPSLRCDSRSVEILRYLVSPHRANLTFAVESGTERLREYVHKNITDASISETILTAYNLGWRLVKLYFMIGLPTETDEDIQGIVALVKKLRKMTPGMRYNITISPFVPKPHTPFQREVMCPEEILMSRRNTLIRQLKANVKAHNIKMSVLEAVFARGDKGLSSVIMSAWKNGARFDNWKEKFLPDAWEKAFLETGIIKHQYLEGIPAEKPLPWDFVKI
ncbi:MAG: TIGR03960 family B12-binding radical SAM protein, partial [Elusimicrobia bacterium]|nr:TIGR03960 family B12-binding radical SAM protein [Elusimicrobiota bacterium]